MTDTVSLRRGPWNLADLKDVPNNGLKVFSCFHCGGGSTMGYKLAGFEVLGGVEIDKRMMALYQANHNPEHSYLMGVQEFKNIPNSELPKELFELDILDGSPPCSSFSMAGNREKNWGDKKKFREGQAEQVLDDLFFHFIEIADKLKPKVVIAENVPGMLLGNARGYVKEIFAAFKAVGYHCQLFLCNAAKMGVPQSRKRVFFIANRLGKTVSLDFNEPEISVMEAFVGIPSDDKGRTHSNSEMTYYWAKCKPGESYSKYHPKGSLFNFSKLDKDKPSKTLLSSSKLIHFDTPRFLSKRECIRLQTFPEDYDFQTDQPAYVVGMSVPPFMMQRVANQVRVQIFGGVS